jgi:hypothetical protein
MIVIAARLLSARKATKLICRARIKKKQRAFTYTFFQLAVAGKVPVGFQISLFFVVGIRADRQISFCRIRYTLGQIRFGRDHYVSIACVCLVRPREDT